MLSGGSRDGIRRSVLSGGSRDGGDRLKPKNHTLPRIFSRCFRRGCSGAIDAGWLPRPGAAKESWP